MDKAIEELAEFALNSKSECTTPDEKLKALFAHAVNLAIEDDYIDSFDICDALDIPHPVGGDDEYDDARIDAEYQAMYEKFDEAFEKFFGYSRHNIPCFH